ERGGPKLSQAESLMLGLRLLEEGVADATFRREHGVGLWERFGSVLEHLMAEGLLRFESERILLTHRGLLFHNRVAEALLPS
ncbi:MAG: coproporphyrinogen III oxidase family protein, partial [Caldilineaceae bacterium SB0666_bin_21]|nr:coproporphyrinogen III oxidase family protein [Caldilineaceae bacterium SB0666_bin_21]